MWLYKLGRSFRYAGRGFAHVLRRERNLRIHLTAVFYVSWAGILGRLGGAEWALLWICFAMVIGAELFNTAIETLGNAVTREKNETVGKAKDVAAGAVLVCAVGSVGAAAGIFGCTGAWKTVLRSLGSSTPLSVIAIATVPAAILFIRGRGTWK
ncbi:diacylglycerol kinase family protein [Papillibacter cinnamivorans]|uniref:Diacylglycerol kinase n=1 Tax=Papillibacter cinnamivorans DSM 12816 TaxID=1122930 RepID=A0A1W1YZS2_9FIRM|nr:diacylglycerol kinase family protein [Papillibacter cinnamivorans]SMC41690.1 diacylglycerol kinase [Papillibacter cinnamivorans DSM 12816]